MQAPLIHDDARTVLALLDAVRGAVAPIEGSGRLDDYGFTADGTVLVGI